MKTHSWCQFVPGARVSMPGMMDTILNIGLNDETVEGLAKQSGKPEFAWDTYRRFIHMLGKIIVGIDARRFDGIVAGKDLSNIDALKTIVASSKSLYEETGNKFPADPYEQIELAIEAVFRSWMAKRAVEYRKQYNITSEMAGGTAVTIVAMVFGNMGSDSCTGVVFTRDPETGEKRPVRRLPCKCARGGCSFRQSDTKPYRHACQRNA